MSMRSFLAFFAVLAVLGLLAFGLLNKGTTKIAVGDPVPDRVLPELPGPGRGSIAQQRGKWVLVNFWASWCKPCEEESPAIESFAKRHAGNLVVLGINSEDNSVDANAFIREYGLTWEMVKDTGDRSEAYGVLGFPESFLVDPNGKLALIQRGPMDERFLNEQVAPLIAGATVRQ